MCACSVNNADVSTSRLVGGRGNVDIITSSTGTASGRGTIDVITSSTGGGRVGAFASWHGNLDVTALADREKVYSGGRDGMSEW